MIVVIGFLSHNFGLFVGDHDRFRLAAVPIQGRLLVPELGA
jgi:hypothetical protein